MDFPKHEFIWGAEAIQQALGLKSRRQVYYALEAGQVAGARKVAGRWCLHLPRFRQSFDRHDAGPRDEGGE